MRLIRCEGALPRTGQVLPFFRISAALLLEPAATVGHKAWGNAKAKDKAGCGVPAKPGNVPVRNAAIPPILTPVPDPPRLSKARSHRDQFAISTWEE